MCPWPVAENMRKRVILPSRGALEKNVPKHSYPKQDTLLNPSTARKGGRGHLGWREAVESSCLWGVPPRAHSWNCSIISYKDPNCTRPSIILLLKGEVYSLLSVFSCMLCYFFSLHVLKWLLVAGFPPRRAGSIWGPPHTPSLLLNTGQCLKQPLKITTRVSL